MLHVRDIHYSIGEREILSGITISVEPGEKYILTGNNGAGKTTFFRIISGKIEPDTGRIVKPGIYRIGYLPQEVITEGDLTTLQLVIEGKKEVSRIWSEMERIHTLLKRSSGPDHEILIDKLGDLEQKFISLGGYELEVKARTLLSGLGFLQKDFNRSLSEFSGGWRMRAYLAMILIQEPDLILLDEPTNHLDIPSMEWLEQYLSSFPGSVILVSHDIYFINRIGGRIVELESGKFIRYRGNYEEYEIAKRERIQALEKKKREQDRELARQERFIERFRYKNTKASLVQSRIKALKKIEKIELPSDSPKLNFRIESGIKSYKDVLHMENVDFAYTKGVPILNGINFRMYRGEKSALIGKNGSGKTTLTKLITDQLTPVSGRIEKGGNVVTGYYAQHQIDALNLESTVLEEVSATAAQKLIPKIRDILGIFQFKDDEVFKKIKILSGGEKARVSLAKILLSPVNFLIMDEPTTHLDKIAKKALQNALMLYEGTLLLISHDRYFIDNIVNKIILLKDGSLTEYPGNYSYYSSKFAIRAESAQASGTTGSTDSKKAKGKKSREQKRAEAEARQAVSAELNSLKKRVDELEIEIDKLEFSIKEIEKDLSLPQTYEDKTLTVSLQKELHKKKSNLEKAYKEWEEKHKSIDKIRSELP